MAVAESRTVVSSEAEINGKKRVLEYFLFVSVCVRVEEIRMCTASLVEAVGCFFFFGKSQISDELLAKLT